MPNANVTSPARVVIDETSFDFRGLDTASIEMHLDDFNDTVWTLRADGIPAWRPPMLDAVNCVDGYELFEYLENYSKPHVIEKKKRARVASNASS